MDAIYNALPRLMYFLIFMISIVMIAVCYP